jgi:hypothetical protein
LTGLRFEAIDRKHRLGYFDSGVPTLDDWLRKEALAAHRGGLSRTHVSTEPDDAESVVQGYFTLAPTIVTEQIPGSTGSRRDGYPSYVLAKLARNLDVAGTGHGAELLAEAVVKTVEAADAVGGRFLVVDPHFRDLTPEAADKLRRFYRKLGFADLEESNRMYVTISTLRKELAAGGE